MVTRKGGLGIGGQKTGDPRKRGLIPQSEIDKQTHIVNKVYPPEEYKRFTLAEHQFRIIWDNGEVVKSATKNGTASQTYCRQLSEMAILRQIDMNEYINIEYIKEI